MLIWPPYALATEIVPGFAAVLGPGAAVRRPQNASRIRSVPRGAEKEVQSSGLQWICCILSPRPAPEARAQNRLGWAGLGWLGWLGWLAGLQSAVCSVPEDSVPFGRGPAGCGGLCFDPGGPGHAPGSRDTPRRQRGELPHRTHIPAVRRQQSAYVPRSMRGPIPGRRKSAAGNRVR